MRTMLLGVEKKGTEEVEVESALASRTEASEVDDRGVIISKSYKDVGIVSELRGCPTSMSTAAMERLDSEMMIDRRPSEAAFANPKVRFQDDRTVDFYSRSNGSVAFEFEKAEKAPHRAPFASFSKPAPSKWDDAEKWIASPQSKWLKTGQSQGNGGQAFAYRKTAPIVYGNRPSATTVVVEVPEQTVVAHEEADTKQIDVTQGEEDGDKKLMNWASDNTFPMLDSHMKPVLEIEKSILDSAVCLSRHGSSVAILSATTFIAPPSTIRSVSMRDMGTEMTPIVSQEPSRTGTPARATPIRSSPSSSPSTPERTVPTLSSVGTSCCPVDHTGKELSEKELQMKTRREIMALGTQLGKMNIAAWAGKDEGNDASTSLNTVSVGQPPESVIETCSAAWVEAEKAKYMARYRHEEMKIQAWENHQKAKTEAEMMKIEVEVERMRECAHDKLMNKLATARHKAEEKRAAAEAKRSKQAARTEQQAESIKRTGHVPTSFICCNWCY